MKGFSIIEPDEAFLDQIAMDILQKNIKELEENIGRRINKTDKNLLRKMYELDKKLKRKYHKEKE